jgi:protease IV
MSAGTRRFWWSVGAIFLLCIAAGLVARWWGVGGRRPGRPRVVLDVNLDSSYPEAPTESTLGRLLSTPRPTLAELTTTIDRAARDEAVTGLVARVGSAPLGVARAQEVRDAIERFRSHKKFALAYADTFGEGGNGSVAYYLASAFDEIWMQPSGDLWLTGVAVSTPFIRGTLDKLAVTPAFGQRYEYKNAMNFYTDRKFTEAHREALEKLKDSWFGQVVRGIAEGRKLTPEAVRAAVDRAPLLGPEAVEAKLLDGLAYRDEVIDKAEARGRANVLSLAKYRASLGEPAARHTLALVYGVGEVARGKSDSNPFLESAVMGADSVGAALRAAASDTDVEAIVFRVDSPGGSYVASDTIWREVGNARHAGKPVVVSMGDLAGSGGYFVALNADKIVAQPGTITGSIGVLGGKFVLAGLFDKLGISFDEVHSGEHALFWDPNRDFSPSERARFEAWLDRVYDDFTRKVAAGRHLPRERVLEIARGRIWSGEDAKALGLVDELGGLATAVRLARKEAKIPAGESVRLVPFPRERTLFETLRAHFSREPDDEAADVRLELTRGAAAAFAPIARRLRALGLAGDSGVLSMPPTIAD